MALASGVLVKLLHAMNGAGEWRTCQTAACSDDEVVVVDSYGAFGFIPYIFRYGGQSMWAIVGASGFSTSWPKQVMTKLLPAAVTFPNLPPIFGASSKPTPEDQQTVDHAKKL